MDARLDDYIGLRIARYRDVGRLTQRELADAVGVSREHLSRVENGRKAVTDRRMLYAFATALGVSVTDLTGQPAPPRSQDDLVMYSAVPALRGALDDDPEDDSRITASMLAAEVDRAMAARMACDYHTLAALLPGLVMDARRLADEDGDSGRVGLELFVRAAVCASLTIKPFGHIDLATRLGERARIAAVQLGSPASLAAADFALAQTALASGTVGGRRRSLAAATRAADQIGDVGGDEALSWYGMLHLQAALSAATLGRVDEAAAHHSEATAVAARVSADPWRMEVTPANVGVWRVAIALESGEPDRAPQYARAVDRTGLRTRQRLAHLHIACGRGWYQAGKPDKAVRQFLAADTVAPSELRSRPSVREIVGQMVRDARRRGGPELRKLALRVGVDPLDPDLDAGVV
ncbi:helix-turn-helix domain-containing protein [Micromonospora tulbaghiae]|nr:helix-turn-helix transcriptional regulator [Micromonospora tulbaghiae]